MTDAHPRTPRLQDLSGSRVISTPELLGFITYFGRDFLQTVEDPRRYEIVRIGRQEYRKPSPSLLGEIERFGDLTTATPAIRTQLEKLISRKLRGGGTLIRSSWLRSLGTAMSMTESQIGIMCERFSEESSGPRIGDYTDLAQVRRAVKHYENVADANLKRRERSAMTQTQLAEQLQEVKLREACRQALTRVSAAPSGYPETLDASRLGAVLPGVVLSDGWEERYSAIQGLYSEMSRHGKSPLLGLLKSQRRSVVLGDPGHGKSTAIIAAADAAEAEGNLVFFAQLEFLDDVAALSMKHSVVYPSQRTPEWAAEMVVEAAIASGLVLDAIPRDVAVRSILTDANVLVALDGWDEIKSDRYAAATVLELISENIPGKLAITSRVTGYRRFLTDPIEVLVCPMAPEHVAGFFEERLAGRDEAMGRVDAALRNPMIASMARVPVLSNFIAFVAESHKPSDSIHGLYRQYVNLFLERRWQRSSKNSGVTAGMISHIQQRLRVAGELAFLMATQLADPESGRTTIWADYMSLADLAAAVHANDAGTIEELVFSDGLLVPHGIIHKSGFLDQEYRWIHRTVQEHLVARELVRMARAGHPEWRKFLRNAVLCRSWTETLRHFYGLLSETGHLRLAIDEIRCFQQEGDDVTRRLTTHLVSTVLEFGSSSMKEDIWQDLIRDLDVNGALRLEPEQTQKYFKELDLISLSPQAISILAANRLDGLNRDDFRIDLARRIVELDPENHPELVRELKTPHRLETEGNEDPGAEGWFCERFTALPTEKEVRAAIELLSADVGRPDVEDILNAIRSAAEENADVRGILSQAVERHGMNGSFVMALFDENHYWTKNPIEPSFFRFLVQGDAAPVLAYQTVVNFWGQIDCLTTEMSPWARAGYVSNLTVDHGLDEDWSLEMAQQAFDHVTCGLYDILHPVQAAEVEDFWLSIRVLLKYKDHTRLNKMLVALFAAHDPSWATWWLRPLFFESPLFADSFSWAEIRTALDEIWTQINPNFFAIWRMVQNYTSRVELAQAVYDFTKLFLRTNNGDLLALSVRNPANSVTAFEAIFQAAHETVAAWQPPILVLRELVLGAEIVLWHDDLLPRFWPDMIKLSSSANGFDSIDLQPASSEKGLPGL